MKKLSDTELSLLGTDITENLLISALGDTADTRELCRLGLLEKSTVTDEGRKILSAYPFFGRGKGERRDYPALIFAFLLALSRSKSARDCDSTYYRRKAFLDYFPTREKSVMTSTGYYITTAMDKLGLFTREGLLNKKVAEAFMSLSALDRMSYIVAALIDAKAENAKMALTLISLIDGIERERLPLIERAVKAYSSISPDWTLFENLGLIYWEDGLLYSALLEREERDDDIFTLSSDYTITTSSTYDRDIYLIAHPVVENMNTVQWKIDRSSIRRAFNMDVTYDEIIAILKDYSSYPVPEAIEEQIKSWEREYNLVRIVRGTVVRVDERYSSLFTLPGISEHIIEKLGENAFLMDSDVTAGWMMVLSGYGVSMLPVVKGPLFDEKSPYSGIYCWCYPIEDYNPLPLRRGIPFDEEGYLRLLSEAEDEWERLLIKSHLVFSRDAVKAYKFIDGLEYSSKRVLILDAIKDGKALVIKNTDDTYLFLIPHKLEGDTLTTDKGDVAVSKIWKVTAVAKDVLRKDP